MKLIHFFPVLLLFLTARELSAQDSSSEASAYPAGLSINYGLGIYSVKDEYISMEKYSGEIPYFSISWSRAHKNYVYKLEGNLMHSKQIKNNNISTEITLARIRHGFLYPLKNKKVFNKDLNLWLGPSTTIFIYTNLPAIAVDGFNFSQSDAGLFSLGVNLEGYYHVTRKIELEASLGISVLSLGLHNIDRDVSNESSVKPLTFINALDLPFNLGARYYFGRKFSAQINYKFELVGINAWENLLSAGDYGVIGISYTF